MPPVNLFGKEWRIGTDDFVYSSIVELMFRIGWSVGIAFVLGFHLSELGNLECLGQEYKYTTAYLSTALILQTIISVNLTFLAYHSSLGTIFDKTVPHPRRHVSLLIYLNIILTTTELFLTFAGTYFVIKDWTRCGGSGVHYRTVLQVVMFVIGCTYIILFIKMIVALTTIKPFSGSDREEERQLLNQREKQSSEDPLRKLRCCLMPFTRDESTILAFQDISKILSSVFHDSQLVPSDIVSGLIALHYKNKQEKESGSIRRSNSLQAGVVAEDDLANLKYYYKYSLAAYGYMWFVLDSPCVHFWSLAHYAKICGCLPMPRLQEGLLEYDGCCNCNLAAARAVLELAEEDFLVFDNRNRIQETPYYLAVDHEKRSLVISIRGTLSLSDMFTDLRGGPCLLSECVPEIEFGLHPTHKGHRGIIEAARYVYRRLHGLPVSEKDEEVDRMRRIDIMNLSLDRFQDYSLVVTGHSLGAGAAAILAFLLRSNYPDRDIKCYAYSPPGGLLCPAAAAESEKFTVSLVVGDDVIPRTSLPNLAKLSYDIRDVCERCELPKYKLFGYGVMAVCCCHKSTTIHEEMRRLFPVDEGSSSRVLEFNNALNQENGRQASLPETSSSETPVSPISVNSSCQLLSPDHKDGASSSGIGVFDAEPMVLPGRVVYLEEDPEGKISISTKTKDSFDTILVTPRMLADHMPNYISKILSKI